MALIGNTNEEKIWNFFIKELGNPYGVAGLMGNLQAESSLNPNNLQNNGNSELNLTDAEFTAKVDSGEYSRDTFINDKFGYGLAQWTFYTLKEDLYDYWQSYGGSIGDLEMQCKFLLKEFKEDFKVVYNTLVNATSVLEASNVVLLKFERPADKSEGVQNKRAGFGQNYYTKYATKQNTPTIGTFTPRLTRPEAGNKYYITKDAGGYSSAIKGKPTDKQCNVLSNCVGYAYGRFNEIGGYGSCKYLYPTNAENFMQHKGSCKSGDVPKLGACMVWQKGSTLNGSDGAGHVAIVEQIISPTEIVTSESGWNSSTPFWTKTRKKGNGNWGAGSAYKFLGFIYNPAVPDNVVSTTPSQPEQEAKRLYENGDLVDFTGTKHYLSSNSTSPAECKPGVAKVTNWAKNGKHKYHLVRVSGGATVYGWVDEADIKGLHKEDNTQTGGTTMGYTNSSLVSYTKISPNRTSPRNHAIDTITIHCVVGQCSVETLGNVFAPTSRQASSNYGIGYDGKVGMYVEEKDRSWCSSNAANDHRAITIEVASDTTHPYAVNDKALASLIKLVADICKRNGIKKLVWSTNKNERVNHLNGCNMTVHRDYANKSCPGDYLYNKHGYIASEVNKLLGVNVQPAQPTQPTTGLQFDKGDIVNFVGGYHYGSASATSGTAVKASKAKVTNTYPKGKHPYHLRAVNDKGAFISGVYGWVDASTVSAIQTSTPAPSPTTPAPTQPVTIVAGTKLTLKNVNLYASSGTAKSAGVRSGTFYAWSKDVINNRIRITNSTANVGKAGQVTGWINYTDAKNAAGVTSTPPSTNTFTPYKVQVTTGELNIRKGAGTNYAVVGCIKDKGVYTIVGESSGKGATKWGKLKSCAGFISLDYCKKI